MEDNSKSREQLLSELSELRGSVAELKALEAKYRQTETMLKESEEKYRSIFENAVEGMFQSTPDGRFLSVNPALAHMCGYDSPEEMIENITDVARQHYADPKKRRLFRKILDEQGFVENFEHLICRRDGSTVWVSINARAVRDDNGNVLYYEGTHENISKRKLIEEKLRESEERQTDIVQFLPDPTLVIDHEGKVTGWNLAMEELTGVKSEVILGKGNYEYALPFYGERRPILIDLVKQPSDEFESGYASVERRGSILSGEAYMPALNGGGVYLYATATALRNSRGEITGAIESIRDITERKLAEERLRASEIRYRRLFEAAKEGILIIDAETGRIDDANPYVIDMLGYSYDELIGKQVWEIEPFKNTVVTEFSFSELKENMNIFYDNLQLVTKDGWNIIAELVGNAYPVNNKKVIQFNMQNVSDLKWAEELLKEEKETFFAILENNPSGVALFDSDGVYQYVNPQFTGITGYTLDDIPTAKDWFHKAYPDPDYRHYVRSRWTDNLEKIRTGEKEPVTLNVMCKDGAEKIIKFVSIQLRTNEYMTTCWDVTREKHAEEERERLILELQEALTKVKTLSGLLPVCSSCKKIRNDKGHWEQMEIYIRDRSEADFSHGICPECAEKLYPEYYKKK